jgi:uncharacterized protein
MSEERKLDNPWLVAVWPGMGHVAISAGYYLMAKLGMHLLAEFATEELFDIEHVEVKGGLVHPGRLPRSRVFAWQDPRKRHDILVFIGEAQPPRGKAEFCRRLVEFAKGLQVERVFTFAAMGTRMHPDQASRVFGAATDAETLAELEREAIEILEDGHIGGLNGVLLGVAAERGLHGACLLGEMPHIFAQLAYPKASLAVLEVFATIAGVAIDLGELAEQARDMEEKLRELLAQVEPSYEQPMPSDVESSPAEPAEEEGLSPADRQRIERFFDQAAKDRSHAYELKRELDRLGVYPEYEDRFLDLFKKSD